METTIIPTPSTAHFQAVKNHIENELQKYIDSELGYNITIDEQDALERTQNKVSDILNELETLLSD